MTTISTGSSYIDSLASSGTTASTTASAKKDTIDQKGFLKLLTTQLQTQDPTAPTDNSQMIAQMAQFSSLTGISEMNASMKAMASDIAAARFGDASGWIGRAALVESNVATPLSNGSFAGQITLPEDATALVVSLVDGNGQTVKSVDLGEQAKGVVDFGWDGKDADGKAVAGPLKVNVAAVGANGSLAATTATWVPVQSVQSPASGSTKLITALGSYAPADVRELA